MYTDQLKSSTVYGFKQLKSIKHNVRMVYAAFLIVFMSTSVQAIEQGEKAPDFELKTFAGEAFRLSDFNGKKPVYLVFWATWCPICKAEIPNFKKIHASVGDKVQILGINVGYQDTLEKAQAYKKEQQIPYAVAFDENTVITKQYGVLGTPWQVVIDINGIVRYSSNTTPEAFETHLEELYKKN